MKQLSIILIGISALGGLIYVLFHTWYFSALVAFIYLVKTITDQISEGRSFRSKEEKLKRILKNYLNDRSRNT